MMVLITDREERGRAFDTFSQGFDDNVLIPKVFKAFKQDYMINGLSLEECAKKHLVSLRTATKIKNLIIKRQFNKRKVN